MSENNLLYINENISRRDFIKKSLKTIFAVSTISYLTIEILKNNKKLNSEIFTSNILECTDFRMQKGFKRYKIVSKYTGNSQEFIIGDLLLMNDPNSKVNFLSRTISNNKKYFEPKIDFSAIYEDYNKQGKNVTIQVAGAFTPDWQNIEGLGIENGKEVGGKFVPKWKGFLVIENSKPKIIHVDDIDNLYDFYKEMKIKGNSMFQQISVIRNGEIDDYPNFSDDKKINFRFFVEIETESSSKYGVIDLNKRMNINNAIKVLKDLKVKNALYLDVGGVSGGYFYETNGNKNIMIDDEFNNKISGYTNLLVFYSQ